MDTVLRGMAKIESLSAAELQIIRSMIVKQYGLGSPFMDQLAGAGVEKRRMTGMGIFVDLLVAENVGRVDAIDCEITEAYRTSLPSPRDLVGFTLFIRGGYLSFLEGYTFGNEAWPKEAMEDWLIFDASVKDHS
jgi:hypothetical protein